MDAHQAEEMANSMMLNSPLLDPERSEGKLLEDDGSKKLPKEGGGEKLPEEIPTGKLIMPFAEGVLPFFPLLWFYNPIFPLDSQNPGNTVGRIEEAPHTKSGLCGAGEYFHCFPKEYPTIGGEAKACSQAFDGK